PNIWSRSAKASRALLELCCFLGALRRVPGAIGVCAGARELALIDDQIFVADGPALEIALQDFARAGRVTRLRGERRAGDMRRHAMMRHAAPRMVLRCWLREPDIARIAGELAAFERPHDGIAVADFSAR